MGLDGSFGPVYLHPDVIGWRGNPGKGYAVQRDVFHFRSVGVPYEVARRFLRDDPACLFSPAIDAESADRDEVVGCLEVDVDGIILGADVTLEIGDFEEIRAPLPLARRKVGWHASEHEGMFPILIGELEAFPMGEDRTQVTFTCHYRPPLSAVGAIADTLYLHRVAEECLAQFFSRLVRGLEESAQHFSS